MGRRDEIDRLAALLEGRPDAEGTTEDRRLGALATMLRESQPEVPPMRAEFRASLRQEVVAAAREQVVEPPLLTKIRATAQRFKYSTGLAGATGMASVALAGGGVAGAAEHAQPGDALYGTKLAIEDLRLGVTFDELARGQRALVYAADRIAEAETALAEGDQAGAATALRGAITRHDEAGPLILASGDIPSVLDLFDEVTAQTAAVTRLADGLAGDAGAAAQDLLDDLGAAQQAIGVVVPGVLPPAPAPAAPTTATPPPEVTTPPVGGPAAPDVPTSGPAEPLPDQPAPVAPADPADPPQALPGLEDLPDVELPIDGIDTPSLPVPEVTGVVEDVLDELLEGVDGQ